MNRTEKQQDKWSQPGWRIEKKYANKVLIGNWAEERLQFTREPKTASSTNRVDYQPHWDVKPDVSERGCALLRAEGLQSKQLFAHYGPTTSHYLVTQYEQSYGRQRTNGLPALRPWRTDSSTTWQLQRFDRPNSDVPASFGLPSLTVYRSTYQRHPLAAFCQNRHARASRSLSSHLYTANHNNKDLELRRHLLLQVPDQCFSLQQA